MYDTPRICTGEVHHEVLRRVRKGRSTLWCRQRNVTFSADSLVSGLMFRCSGLACTGVPETLVDPQAKTSGGRRSTRTTMPPQTSRPHQRAYPYCEMGCVSYHTIKRHSCSVWGRVCFPHHTVLPTSQCTPCQRTVLNIAMG